MNIDEKTTVGEWIIASMREEFPKALARAWLVETPRTYSLFERHAIALSPFYRTKPLPDTRGWMHAAAVLTRRELTHQLFGNGYFP